MGRGLEAGWGLAEGRIQQRFVGEWVEGGGRGVPPPLRAQLERRGLRPSLCCIVTPPWVAPLCVLLGFLHPNSPSSASWGRIRGNISPLPYPQSSQPMLEGSPSAAGRARHELGCLAHHKHCPKKATKAPLCSQTAQHIHTAHPTALGLGMDWLGWLYWHSPSVRAGSALGLTGAPSTELLLALVSS